MKNRGRTGKGHPVLSHRPSLLRDRVAWSSPYCDTSSRPQPRKNFWASPQVPPPPPLPLLPLPPNSTIPCTPIPTLLPRPPPCCPPMTSPGASSFAAALVVEDFPWVCQLRSFHLYVLYAVCWWVFNLLVFGCARWRGRRRWGWTRTSTARCSTSRSAVLAPSATATSTR